MTRLVDSFKRPLRRFAARRHYMHDAAMILTNALWLATIALFALAGGER